VWTERRDQDAEILMTIVATGRPPFRAAFPLVEAKLRPATSRPGAVARTRLVALLDAEPGCRVTSVLAPPGYGKTTLLAQWAASSHLPAAWLTVDDGDNDPAVLLAYLAAALDHVTPVGEEVARVLAGPSERILARAVPQLASALHGWSQPALLVIDDAHRLVDRPSLDALASLVDGLPPGFRVAIAARSEPGLPLARLRVQQDLLELTARELALDEAETKELAVSVGCDLPPDEVRDLTEATEGWAAGIYLTALALARGDDRGPALIASPGRTAHLAAYLRSEVEQRLDSDDRAFLARTAILEPVEPAIAEAVSGMPGAAERLRRIAHDNLLLSEVGGGTAFRYHHLLRDFLLDGLEANEPGSTPELHRRASEAYATRGRTRAAVEHALAAGDRGLAASLVVRAGLPMFNSGQVATIDRWLATFTPADFDRHPPLAVLATWIHLMAGRADEAERSADVIERSRFEGPAGDGSASFASQRAIVLALMCRHGPRDMLANASIAVAAEGPGSPWRSHALFMEGAAWLLLGDPERAAPLIDDSIDAGIASGAPTVIMLTTRARILLGQGAIDTAARLVDQALDRAVATRLEESTQVLATQALCARLALATGDRDLARTALVRAQVLRPLAHAGTPWVSVAALLDLVHAHLALSDVAGAQVALREAEQIVRLRPALGILTDELVAARRQVEGAAGTLVGSSALTAAELRVLMLLPTYLSFQEIADRLRISRNTVKTHAVAIYGKLWASSRGEAVERAVELGLLEPYPALRPTHGDGRRDGPDA
jgi:LuxR family maltose regulon positive regulatory protein